MEEKDEVENTRGGLVPRSYQILMEKKALQCNTILFLPTGSGKTFVAIQVIKRLQHGVLTEYSKGGMRTFFLVNSVPLVSQQTDMLSRQLALTVTGYSSENKVDLWKLSDWNNELEKYQVLVMTAQILLDMLLHGYITLDRINLIVFDECHHAVDSHPMRRIMAHFETTPQFKRPKVLGLTATLINKNVKLADVSQTVKEVEKTFNAKICTVDSINEVSFYSTNPQELTIYYPEERAHHCVQVVKSILSQLSAVSQKIKIPETLSIAKSPPKGIPMVPPPKLPKAIKNMTDSIERALLNLGVYGGSIAILCYIVQCERLKLSCDVEAKHNLLQVAITYLTQARAVTEEALNTCSDNKEKLLKFSHPKIKKFLEMLMEFSPTAVASGKCMKVNQHKTQLCCLVFVKERFTSKVIYKILDNASQCLPSLDYLKTDFVVGTNINPYGDTREELYNKKQNSLVLEKFRAKQLNCLISTEVLEEGVDIPTCNLVVRVDPIISFRSYVQAKGRCRSKTSVYAIMVEETDHKFALDYNLYKAIEETLNVLLVGRTRNLPSAYEEADKYRQIYPPYVHNDSRITVNSAVSLLNRYCQSLPQDKFTSLQPEFYLESESNIQKSVSVLLPVACPLKEPMQSSMVTNVKDAKNIAALIACEALHKVNELDEHLLPVNRLAQVFDKDVEKMFFSHWTQEEDGKPETQFNTKRLHFKKHPGCLKGSSKNEYEYFVHCIQMSPHPESDSDNSVIVQNLIASPQGYLILTAHPLPKICSYTMYLASGQVTITIKTGAHVVRFTPQQMEEIKRFHMMVFLDVLGVMKEFTCYDTTHSDNHYWVVPTTDGSTISWATMNRYQSVEAFVEPSVADRKATPTDPDYYRHMVVAPWYRRTGEVPRYIVTKVLGFSPMDPFSDEKHDSYAGYFKTKYNLTLQGSADQPMLEVQHLSGKMNCLLPRSVTLNSIVKRKKLQMNLEQQFSNYNSEQLVPEFCVRYSFPGVLWLKASMLPSLLHRLSQILMAEELRRKMSRDTGLGCEDLPENMDWTILSSDPHSVNSAQLQETEGTKDTEEEIELELAMSKNDDKEMETCEVPEQDAASALMAVHNEDTYKLAVNKLTKEYPWNPDMEPIDLERHFDKVSVADIECYEKFVNSKVNNTNSSPVITRNTGAVVAEEIKCMRAIRPPPFKQVETIEILNRTPNNIGPELRTLVETLTTSKANDIVNLERLETLGDSFLKFGTSLYLLRKFPSFNEGQLTVLKSRIVSNKNLYHSGVRRELPGRIKVENFSAKSGWVPPAFCLEKNIQKILIDNKVSPAALYFLRLSREEILNGCLSQISLDDMQKSLLNWEDTAGYSASLDMYVDRQEVRSKVVSDCVEAIIGAYLQHGGISAAFKVLTWFHILPEQDALPTLLYKRAETPYSQGKTDWNQINFLLDHSIRKIEGILKYTFKDPSLLLEALTHSSNNRNRITGSYERLEYLGDAVLDFLVTCHIYERGGRLTPGELTDLRSALVNNNTFACLLVRLGLHKFIQTSNSLLDSAINKLVKLQEGRSHVVDEAVLYLLEEDDCMLAQYVEVPKTLGDVFESLAGAIYLDCEGHLPTVWGIFYSMMSEEIAIFMQKVPKNPARLLIEQIHAGPQFLRSRCLADGTVMLPLRIWVSGKTQMVYGFGKNKVLAKKSASKMALRLLELSST